MGEERERTLSEAVLAEVRPSSEEKLRAEWWVGGGSGGEEEREAEAEESKVISPIKSCSREVREAERERGERVGTIH